MWPLRRMVFGRGMHGCLRIGQVRIGHLTSNLPERYWSVRCRCTKTDSRIFSEKTFLDSVAPNHPGLNLRRMRDTPYTFENDSTCPTSLSSCVSERRSRLVLSLGGAPTMLVRLKTGSSVCEAVYSYERGFFFDTYLPKTVGKARRTLT